LYPYLICVLYTPSSHPCFDHLNNIQDGVQIMKLLVMYFSQFP
jgi:hypothetical protein